METPLQTYLDTIISGSPDISTAELDLLTDRLSVSELNAKDYYILGGTIQNQIGYICSGLIRAFYIDSNGNEVTVNFIKEGEYATHYPALKRGAPSKFFFQCLEPTVIVNIPYDHLIACCKKSHSLEHYFRLVMEAIFESHFMRVESFLFDNAQKRYLDFIKDNPDLFNRISISDLSSYLGIERQSLTRIRKKLLNK